MPQSNARKFMGYAVAAALVSALPVYSPSVSSAQMNAAQAAPALGMGILPAADVERLLPPSVYFRGQSAPLQLRNAAVYRSATGVIFWASLVDTSGYSTGVRERYQFYLITEQPLRFGTVTLPAGAYGCGFLSDGTALVADLGGHDVATTALVTDAEFRHPRPLQMVADGGAVRLYLGRQYVVLSQK